MYRAFAYLMVLSSVLLAGCDALDRLSKVEVTATSETEVEGNIAGQTLGVFDFGGDFVSFDITQTSAFENNNIGRNNIGESYVTRFYLEVISEENDDLAFIDGMEVYFDDDDKHDDPDNDSGLIEAQVAFIESGNEPEQEQRTLSLTLTDQNIGQFLRNKDLYVHVDASGNPPADNVTIRAEMDVLVNVEW